MRRGAVVSVLAVCLALAPAARADYGLRLTTTDVRVGAVLRGTGYAPGLPVYLVPERRAPRPRTCHGGTAYCPPRSARPPGKPYVLLGRLPRLPRKSRFAFRVPRVVPGRYQVVLWCKPCGGTLLLAGSTLYGQVVTIRR